jgi:N6-adenosine-specific RNA methylase IME4
MLPQALEVGAAWGFRYVTKAFTWAKTNRTKPGFSIGLGYWTRGGTESCLLFTRGSPRRQSASMRELIVAHRREHSRKPDEARERIEAMLPGPYVELFCREPRPGWDAWGDQLGHFSLAAE